ncbi:hypothetical protein ASN18_2526 [Candidatus Magnetominusculus xianensis]|uniref:Transposase n=1 Tax=Candidatus Magnetominusculus xianensis TaxID=1748249 RepID=A0ABR5SCW6_9BACT|nr:hypothetical protein ASN18_2526 [Candidatus Magnetominusculus xianensis]
MRSWQIEEICNYACMRKLLTIINVIVTNNTPWNEDYSAC